MTSLLIAINLIVAFVPGNVFAPVNLAIAAGIGAFNIGRAIS